jgi:hypothetical protein
VVAGRRHGPEIQAERLVVANRRVTAHVACHHRGHRSSIHEDDGTVDHMTAEEGR